MVQPEPAAPLAPHGTSARLSYVGVPRSLRWGYSYAALCLTAVGCGLASFSTLGLQLGAFFGVLAGCYARFVGVRVRVEVMPRSTADGYDVTTRVAGWVRHFTATQAPELETTELGLTLRKQRFSSVQLAVVLRLGGADLTLPSLHAGAGVEDARARLEPFRSALRALGEPDPKRRSTTGGEKWQFPSIPGLVDDLRWAKGRGDARLLRHGVTFRAQPELQAATTLFAAALVIIALSALLPGEQSALQRAVVVGVSLGGALWLRGMATYRLCLRLVSADAGPVLDIVRQALGFTLQSRRVPVGEGLRLLHLTRTTGDSDGTSRERVVYLVSRDGNASRLMGLSGEDDARRRISDDFGASLADRALLEQALQPQPAAVAAKPLKNDCALPRAFKAVPHGSLSRLNTLGLLFAALALLFGFGSLTRELLDLRDASAWIETRYFASHIVLRNGNKGRLVARPALDPSVVLEPRPPGTVVFNDVPCWVIDDPHGHDIARYTRPSAPPTLTDKLRASAMTRLGFCLMLAAAAAGPWLRARRSLDVRAV